MKSIHYFLISFLVLSCASQKGIFKKNEVDAVSKLIRTVCINDSLSFENKAIENHTNKRLDKYFHCSLKKINADSYRVTLVLATKRPHQDIAYETIKVNDFDCFLYDDDLSSAFWIP
ncbi:MAG: hypothetical protein EOO51_13215, partial [Flavobacterium sp.]